MCPALQTFDTLRITALLGSLGVIRQINQPTHISLVGQAVNLFLLALRLGLNLFCFACAGLNWAMLDTRLLPTDTVSPDPDLRSVKQGDQRAHLLFGACKLFDCRHLEFRGARYETRNKNKIPRNLQTIPGRPRLWVKMITPRWTPASQASWPATGCSYESDDLR